MGTGASDISKHFWLQAAVSFLYPPNGDFQIKTAVTPAPLILIQDGTAITHCKVGSKEAN
jgi:hypothetical protein